MKFVIKGHSKRGKEIIELLESFGANSVGYTGTFNNFYYWIEEGEITSSKYIPFNSITFTIEEFLEKYPYKVGDKAVLSGSPCAIKKVWWDDINNEVLYKVQGKGFVANCDANSLKQYKEQKIMKYKVGDKVKIKSLDWYNTNKDKEDGSYVDLIHTTSSYYNFIEPMTEFCGKIMTIKDVHTYNLDSCYDMVEDDGEFYWTDNMIEGLLIEDTSSESVNSCYDGNWGTLTITNEEAEKHKIQIPPEFPQSINLSQSNVNEIEVVLGDYEFVLKDGKTYFIKKKPIYPKTYEECCATLCPDVEFDKVIHGYNYELLKKFGKLLIYRDADWKIAGELMGLDKLWKQDYDDRCFIIANSNGNIHTYEYHGTDNIILAFPTKELRDTFYANFKDLIEECKELL